MKIPVHIIDDSRFAEDIPVFHHEFKDLEDLPRPGETFTINFKTASDETPQANATSPEQIAMFEVVKHEGFALYCRVKWVTTIVCTIEVVEDDVPLFGTTPHLNFKEGDVLFIAPEGRGKEVVGKVAKAKARFVVLTEK